LRNFSTLTKGDDIMVNYNNKNYYIHVVEVQPGSAISIVEADVNTEFAPALDQIAREQREAEEQKKAMLLAARQRKGEQQQQQQQQQQPETKTKPISFPGQGQRLDGKAAGTTPPALSSSPAAFASSPKQPAPAVAPPAQQRPKLVFGKGLVGKQPGAAAAPAAKKAEEKKEDKPGFVAFSGAGYSLK